MSVAAKTGARTPTRASCGPSKLGSGGNSRGACQRPRKTRNRIEDKLIGAHETPATRRGFRLHDRALTAAITV